MQDYTPLMHACKNNNLKLAKLLVSFGADAKAENEEVSKHAACQCIFVMAAVLLCSACIPVLSAMTAAKAWCILIYHCSFKFCHYVHVHADHVGQKQSLAAHSCVLWCKPWLSSCVQQQLAHSTYCVFKGCDNVWKAALRKSQCGCQWIWKSCFSPFSRVVTEQMTVGLCSLCDQLSVGREACPCNCCACVLQYTQIYNWWWCCRKKPLRTLPQCSLKTRWQIGWQACDYRWHDAVRSESMMWQCAVPYSTAITRQIL